MFLSDKDIRAAIKYGELRVEPELKGLQPSSVELHLGREFKTYRYNPHQQPIDPEREQPMDSKYAQPEPYGTDPYVIIRPQEFMLAHTVETLSVGPALACQVDGKSSLARLGLAVHMTSGFIDPGFHGQVTLELFNAAPRPIILRPGMVIAQMFIWRLSSPAERPYGSPGVESRYQHQTGATPSRYGDRVPLSEVPLQGVDYGFPGPGLNHAFQPTMTGQVGPCGRADCGQAFDHEVHQMVAG